MASTIATTDLVAFGTYRLKGEVLEIALGMAIHGFTQHGVTQPLVDTALLYNNAPTIVDAIRRYPNIRIGTKLHRTASVTADLDAEIGHYGSRLHRALLHKYMPFPCYVELVHAKAAGKVKDIGVSNYSAAQLRELLGALKSLDEDGGLPLRFDQAKPDVVQNEFHPFLRTTVPQLCASNGIRFEAHSIFAFQNEYPSAWRDPDASPKIGQRIMAYALQRGGGSVVFNTANYLHLQENLDIIRLPEADLTEMDALKQNACHAVYAGSDTAAFRPAFAHHEDPAHGSGFEALPADYIRDTLAPIIRQDIVAVKAGGVPTKTANGIPSLHMKKKALRDNFLLLAKTVFINEETGAPLVFFEDTERDDDSKMKRLGSALTKLRKALLQHQELMKLKAKPTMCKHRAIEDPEALPVDIPDPSVLQPFIDLVSQTKTLPPTALRMERGVLFPDGRLDFCKQVAQPSFEKLCQAVLDSGAIKHFLIGNNVALANDTDGRREAALGRLIRESHGIETWYLAGNAISSKAVQTVAEAVASNDDARYVWLKMNPIQTGSYHLAKMLRLNPRIEVLDLFNTGQCDDGVHAFLKGLTEPLEGAKVSGLKHLYLDINAITDGAAVAEMVRHFPQLETLSVNVNQVRDAGVQALCDGIRQLPVLPPLQRLVLGSNGATDASIPHITELIRAIPSLVILQLGSYKSTVFFQQQSNKFESHDAMMAMASALADNAKKSEAPELNFFGFQHAYMVDDASQLVLAAADLGLHVNGVQRNAFGQATITSKQLNELLGTPHNVQPSPVDYIQSVYRNNM